MSRLMIALALVGAFLAGGLLLNGTMTQADEPTDPKIRGTLYPKWKEIGLTKEQTQQIYKIRADYGGRVDKLAAEIKKLRAEERAEAEKILTPAQKARLVEVLTGTGDKDKPSDKDKPKDKPTDKPSDKIEKDKTPEKDKSDKDKAKTEPAKDKAEPAKDK